MKIGRNFFENLLAELIARFIIGTVVGGFIALRLLPEIAGDWANSGWTFLACAIAAGLIAAVLGVRKGPGVI